MLGVIGHFGWYIILMSPVNSIFGINLMKANSQRFLILSFSYVFSLFNDVPSCFFSFTRWLTYFNHPKMRFIVLENYDLFLKQIFRWMQMINISFAFPVHCGHSGMIFQVIISGIISKIFKLFLNPKHNCYMYN